MRLETRILIADDEEQICSILARRLTKERYACVTASNGADALNHFHQDKFSLIISDIRMPGMNGLELLKHVKTLDPDMRVIMMTGYREIDSVVEAMRLGACDFILKPFDLDQVVLSIKKASGGCQ